MLSERNRTASREYVRIEPPSMPESAIVLPILVILHHRATRLRRQVLRNPDPEIRQPGLGFRQPRRPRAPLRRDLAPARRARSSACTHAASPVKPPAVRSSVIVSPA